MRNKFEENKDEKCNHCIRYCFFAIVNKGVGTIESFPTGNIKKSLCETQLNEQYAKVEQFLNRSFDEIQKLRSGENPDREEFRKVGDESTWEIMQILDDKQKDEYNKMLDMRRNFRQHDLNNKIK